MAFDMNALRVEAARLESKGQNNNILDNFANGHLPPKEGSIVFRLLPGKADWKFPFVSTRVHRINEKNFHCPMTLVGEKWTGNCPICNWYKALWKDSDSADEETAKALIAEARAIKPVEKFYWNVIIRKTMKSGDVEYNVGPLIYSIGKQLQSKILRAMLGDEKLEEVELGNCTDVETGRDLKIIKTLTQSGKEEYPNYNSSKFLDVSPLGDDEEVARWLSSLHDLTALRKVLSQDELAREVRIHRGLEVDPDTSFAKPTEEAPAPKPAAKVVSKPASQTASVKVKPVVEDADESLADDDFINRLRNM